VLDELSWKPVEVIGQLDPASQYPERLSDRSPARQSNQSGNRPPGAFNDDFLATLSEINQP